MIPHITAALSIGVLVAGIGGTFYGMHLGRALEAGEHMKMEQVARETADKVLAGTASQIAAIEVNNTTIRQTLEREVREKPVFSSCVMDADGLRALNAAITGTEPADNRELPATNTAH